jgi:hypothetical protein
MLHLLVQNFFGGFSFALDFWNLPKSLHSPILYALGYRNVAIFVFLSNRQLRGSKRDGAASPQNAIVFKYFLDNNTGHAITCSLGANLGKLKDAMNGYTNLQAAALKPI